MYMCVCVGACMRVHKDVRKMIIVCTMSERDSERNDSVIEYASIGK